MTRDQDLVVYLARQIAFRVGKAPRLKQGVDPAKARESFEQALAVAREAGLEDSVRPLVELRLADLERFARD